MRRSLAVAALAFSLSCRSRAGSPGAPPGGSPSLAGSPAPAVCDVPEGYRGLPWGTTRPEVLRRNPDAHPSPKDPEVLVRETTLTGAPAVEAFFFDASGGLVSVEARYQPRRTAGESATLTLGMDKMFCPHEVTLADDNRYQVAWVGEGTEVRLTYDMREATPFGPVVAYSKRGAQPTPRPLPSAVPSSAPPGEAGKAFAAAVKAARQAGMHLAVVESPRRGALSLLYEAASEGREIRLTGDPVSGKLLGCATLPAAPTGEAGQLRAERALDEALARGVPVSLGWKSAALAGLVTISFAGGGWIVLDPKAPDALAGSGGK